MVHLQVEFIVHYCRHNRTGLLINHVLRLAGHVDAAILKLGYTRLFIGGRLPVLVGGFLALAVKVHKLGLGQRLYAALLDVVCQHDGLQADFLQM